MNMFLDWSKQKKSLLIVSILIFANIFVWWRQFAVRFAPETLYSSGTAFAVDGTVLTFSERMVLDHEKFNHSLRVGWQGKINVVQLNGTISRGMGERMDLMVKESSSFGTPLLNDVGLDEDLLFNISYLQGGSAKLNIIPLAGEFGGKCFYLIYMQRVQCGSNVLGSVPRT